MWSHKFASGWNVPSTLVSGMHYNALGQVTSDTLGDAEAESFSFANRGWLQSSSATYNTTNVYSLSMTHAPNGDVLSANDSANGNWAYGYDAFNRLVCSNLSNRTCAAPTNGRPTYSYVYDRFGNRWQQNGPHTMLLTFSGSKNRMDGYSYDAAGNLLNDGTHSYTYDAENRIYKVDGGSTATYLYDAEGHAIEKTISASNNQYETAGTWDFLYDLSGRFYHEIVDGQSFWRGEVYAGGRHLATFFEGDTYFDHQDQVGTDRARFSYYSKSNSTIASLPFGDALTLTGAGALQSPDNFTGQRRDPESGLDDFTARHFGSSLGRFLSPDGPFSDQNRENPQSWNLYTYARNNPLRFTDADGRACVQQEDGSFQTVGTVGQSCEDADKEDKNINPSVIVTPSHDDQIKMFAEDIGNIGTAELKQDVLIMGVGVAGVAADAGIGILGARGAVVGATAQDLKLAEFSAILRAAAAAKGVAPGAAETVIVTAAEAEELGKAWVGPGSTVASDGKTLVSSNGLRIYRPPTFKPDLGRVQANLEQKIELGGRPISNFHLDIK